MSDRIDRYWLSLAYWYAEHSPDPSNQNGAVICPVENLDGLAPHVAACNDFPPGTTYAGRLHDRDWKITHIEHAERHAIYEAARRGVLTAGATMYCPWAPCAECARGIAIAGITRLVAHTERMEQTPDRWKASVETGLSILRAAHVRIDFVSAKLVCQPVLVNGELWVP